MRPTALVFNIVAASYTTWLFNRAGLVDCKKLAPSQFAAYGCCRCLIVLNAQIDKTITGLVFLVAAGVQAFQRTNDAELEGPAPLWGAISMGTVIGFVSGLTGVGGGLFLAPLLIALAWASAKQTAALSALLNLANSVLGLLGVMYAGQAPAAQTWLYAIAAGAGAGASIGTSVGLRWLWCRAPTMTDTRWANAHEAGGGTHRRCALVTVAGTTAPMHPHDPSGESSARPFPFGHGNMPVIATRDAGAGPELWL